MSTLFYIWMGYEIVGVILALCAFGADFKETGQKWSFGTIARTFRSDKSAAVMFFAMSQIIPIFTCAFYLRLAWFVLTGRDKHTGKKKGIPNG